MARDTKRAHKYRFAVLTFLDDRCCNTFGDIGLFGMFFAHVRDYTSNR